MKDLFSKQSNEYAKFRPNYPRELVQYIASHCTNRERALDVATGNGQMAVQLAEYFGAVSATDISENQLANATQVANVTYYKMPAEKTDFDAKSFDLIVVAQAIHWFNFEKFSTEVYRLLKDDGIFAIAGYGVLKTNTESDVILDRLYDDILGAYWQPERKYIDEHYKTIPFPYDEIPTKTFKNEFTWTFEQLIGYLETWSATQQYIAKNNANPLDFVRQELQESWEDNDNKVTFPLLLRNGKLKK